VEAHSTSPMLSVHAVKRVGGGMALVLINKHPSQPFQANISIPAASLASTATRTDFGRANFSQSPTWAASGPVTSKMDGVSNNFTVTVPAASESVLIIPSK